MQDRGRGKFSALKCFFQIKEDRKERYQKIAEHFKGQKYPWLLDFSYIDEELSVTPRGQNAELLCPVLLMGWVPGPTLGLLLEQLSQVGDQRTLHAFGQKWATLSQEMMAMDFAHGDLKADNIVVKDYATGWLYLQNLVKAKITSNPNQSIYSFFEVYAPSFENDSTHYAEVVAKACGLKPTDPISKIL